MTFSRKLFVIAMLLSPLLCAQQQTPQGAEFRVALLSPIDTSVNHNGDRVVTRVLTPEQYRGDIVEGEIIESKGGSKLKGTSVLNIRFHTLYHSQVPVPIKVELKSVQNSRGQQNVDEEGRVVKSKNRVGAVLGSTVAGAVLGGVIGGGKGAAAGAAAGLATSLLIVQLASKEPSIRFDPGTEFLLVFRRQ